MIRLADAAKWYKEQPHQVAAWNELQNAIAPAALKAFEELYRAAPAVKPPSPPNATGLKVPYYSQRDSAVSGQAMRMCFSSSCAMLLETLHPGTLQGRNGDDRYLERLLDFGDTTDASAQIKALASYGVKAQFRTNCGWSDIEAQIAKSIPVPIGILHHGPYTAPTGGGHWICVAGITSTSVIVNDPFGELDVASGGYGNSNGKGVIYSKLRLGPRWMAEGPGTGWAIIAQR